MSSIKLSRIFLAALTLGVVCATGCSDAKPKNVLAAVTEGRSPTAAANIYAGTGANNLAPAALLARPPVHVPNIRLYTTNTPCRHNPLGVKGCGEAGAIGSPPAYMNALTDALGVVDLAMPATPERVWRAANGLPA